MDFYHFYWTIIRSWNAFIRINFINNDSSNYRINLSRCFKSRTDFAKEASLALGSTRWEATRIALSYSRSGILGATILGLGRALGETMAVTMVIGNRPTISASLFEPGYTLASVIANEFTEATSDLYISVLIELALVLFVIAIIVNSIARLLVWSVTRKYSSQISN